VRSLRNANQALIDRYEEFFVDPGLMVIALDEAVLDRAAELRARCRLRTPDALQAASLLASDADGAFVAGDTDFRVVPGLQVHIVKTV